MGLVATGTVVALIFSGPLAPAGSLGNGGLNQKSIKVLRCHVSGLDLGSRPGRLIEYEWWIWSTSLKGIDGDGRPARPARRSALATGIRNSL